MGRLSSRKTRDLYMKLVESTQRGGFNHQVFAGRHRIPRAGGGLPKIPSGIVSKFGKVVGNALQKVGGKIAGKKLGKKLLSTGLDIGNDILRRKKTLKQAVDTRKGQIFKDVAKTLVESRIKGMAARNAKKKSGKKGKRRRTRTQTGAGGMQMKTPQLKRIIKTHGDVFS